MKISGFTFAKNATKLYFPIRESVLSILPIVDEFIIVLGDCDEDDQTQEIIEKLGSDKIKIIHSVWDKEKYPDNTVYAHQTDLAKSNCRGDWLFYLQSDEVIHDDDLVNIRSACEKYFTDKEVEGLILKFRHFWGDYDHYFNAHSWYSKEIRLVRNLPEIHSWRDAQSFRVYNTFNEDKIEYLKREGTRKLKVAEVDAYVYHYGWVRPPELMRRKAKISNPLWSRKMKLDQHLTEVLVDFDYGPLDKLERFKGSHPSLMKDWISAFDWKDQLQYSGPRNSNRPAFKHEMLKYRILSSIENKFLGGRRIGGFKNYKSIRT